MDRSALNKATSADDTPTPGYLYTEIAQSTFADLNACQQLADYLIKKLEKDNPHVKLKCLKIIKHVCEQGKPEFKRAIQRKAEVVKACLQYRGTPDPLKGDAPNKAVREEADLAVKAVFSSNASLNAYGFSTGQGKKMQGFGSEPSEDISSRIGNLSSNSFSGGGGSFEGGGRSFGSGGMVGFGNPNFNNAPPRKDDDSVFNKAMSSTMSAVSYLQSKVTGAPPPPMPSAHGGSDGTYRPPAVGGGFGSGDRGGFGGDRGGFGSGDRGFGGGGFNSSYSGGGYSAPSHSYSSAGAGQQNYGIHGPGGAHRRWGHRSGGDSAATASEAPAEATPEAKPAPPPAMVDLLDMEEPSPAQPAPGNAGASLLDEGPAAAASEDLLGGESLMETLNSQTPSFSIPPGEVPGNNLMGSIDMTTAAPNANANANAAAQGACSCGGCGCGGMPAMGMAGSVGGSMGSQAPMMGQPMPQAGGSMGSSMGNSMGQPPMGGPMGGAMGMGGGMMGGAMMGGMGPMGMGAMGCGGCGCGGCGGCGCGMGGPQMGCGMGAMGCGPPMGGPMGMCGGCNMQGSMGGCPNMGMGMMPQQPMNSMNPAAYSPPSAQAPYQNGSMPMQAMGSMSTPSGGGSAFSFIGGSSASPQMSPAPKPPDMAFGFVAEEMKGAVG